MAPAVSVIIPVRDRRDLLRRTLDSLAGQTWRDFEVLVVDDGSVDGSGDVAHGRAADGLPVTVLDGGGQGAVAARIKGVCASTAPVLAFTDSDCEPAPDWLERGLAHIEAGADVVQGRTEPTGPVLPIQRTVWVTEEDGLYATCNVFYRRTAFDAAGGFDPTDAERIGFRPGPRLRDLGFGEDTTLGWRVRRRGASRFASDVVVRHHVFPPDVRSHLERALNAGGFASLVAEVPELRTVFLERRYLLGGPQRVPLYLAVLLGALGARRMAGLALSGWVVGHALALRARSPDRQTAVAALPATLAGDAITAGSLLAGSLRARRLVL